MFATQAGMTPGQRTAARVKEYRKLGLAGQRQRMPRSRPPILIETDYAKAIYAHLGLEAAFAPLIAAMPDLLAAAKRARGDAVWLGEHATSAQVDRAVGAWMQRHDVSSEVMRMQALTRRAREKIDDAIRPSQLGRITDRMATSTLGHQRDQLKRQAMASLGVDVHTLDRHVPEIVAQAVHQNVVLIQSLGRKAADDVEKSVARAFTTGQRAESIVEDIRSRMNVSESHAALIARDQVGSLTSAVNEARCAELGIERFEWATVGDEDVRPEHEELDGQTFSYDEPPSEGLPGEPICCRCSANPVFADILAQLEA